MPNPNSSFQGSILVIPGVYYADNVSAVLQPTIPPTPPLIFIGYGYGQKPQTAQTYTNANNLLSAIRGGPCSGFVPFLCNPSPLLQGAQQITYINPGENTQSALTLYAGVSGVINLSSANYGLPSNLLQIQIQNGTTAGRFITIYDAYGNSTVQGNNLGVPFLLAYLGASSGVSYSVAFSGGVATQLSITSPVTGQSFTIPFGAGQYQTVEQVVEYLNGTGVYNAQVLSSSNGQLPAQSLDQATGIGLPGVSGGISTYVDVTASVGDIVYWVNQFAVDSNGNQLANAVAASGYTPPVAGQLASVIPFTSFSGAVSIPPTLTDYSNAFNLALSLPGWIIFADSNASGVQALGTQHALTASEIVNGKWRRFFTGSTPGDSVNTTVANAEAQDSLRTTYVYPGIYVTNALTGINSLYGGLYAAAAAAGMATGSPANIALTNKPLTGTGVEFTLSASQINTLQQAGVMPLFIPSSTPGVPTICSDLTCWQTDSNPANIFNQQVACRDFTAYTLVNALQPYVGSTASPTIEINLLRAAQRALNALIYTGSGYGTLSSWDPDSLNLVYNGQTQTAAITVNVTLVGQNRFITIYVPIQPLNFTSTLSTTGTAAAA